MNTNNFKKIFVPIDFSETSLRALEHAAFLAKKNEAEVTLVHIIEPVSNISLKLSNPLGKSGNGYPTTEKAAELEERYEEHMRNDLSTLEEKLRKDGIIVGESFIENGKIAKKIGEIAKKQESDLIIMGTHGANGVREFIAGSNTYAVVSEGACPVLSIRENVSSPGFESILLPFIDRPHMREHVSYAIKLAKIYDAKLQVLGIDNEKDPNHFRKVRKEADQIKDVAEKSGVTTTSDVFPSSYMNEFIMSYGQNRKVDLIVVMADMNKIGMMQYLTGPVIQQIVNHSPIPILSIPPSYNPKMFW